MLEAMRKALKGWVGKVLIFIFITPFLFFGASSIFSVFSGGDEPVEVNGEGISVEEIARTVEMNKQQLQQQFGENFDPSLFSDSAMRENAKQQLINQKLAEQYAKDRKLDVSFEKVSEVIREIPAFHDEFGEFSQEMFERVLVQQGLSAKRVIEMIRSDMSVEQVQRTLMSSHFMLETELQDMDVLRNQKRDIAYLELSLEKFRKNIEVSDEQVEDYYQANAARYMTEETLTIDYLTLSPDEFSAQVVISEDDIKQKYESEISDLKLQQERQAAHILIALDEGENAKSAKEKIDGIAKELKAGADFSELAKKYSQDSGTAEQGGDLGMAARGAYVPEFEAALYALESKGAVSEPVLTEFGYHLIKLLDIEDKELPDFDSEKDRIKNLLIAAESRNIFQEKLSEIEEIIYESPDLVDAANLLGKKVLISDAFSRKRGSGIAAHIAVREAAFSQTVLVDKENSALIELDDGQVVVLRANTYNPSVIRGLAEVREQVVSALKNQLAAEQIVVKRDEIIEMLEAGENANGIAQKVGSVWQTKEQIKRQQAGIPAEVLAEAFKMPRPQDATKSISSVSKANGDLSVITLTKVYDGFSEMSAEDLTREKTRSARMDASSVYLQHLNFLKEKANIKVKNESSVDAES